MLGEDTMKHLHFYQFIWRLLWPLERLWIQRKFNLAAEV